MNHGHVTPNADGSLARCGGPGICGECSTELATKHYKDGLKEDKMIGPNHLRYELDRCWVARTRAEHERDVLLSENKKLTYQLDMGRDDIARGRRLSEQLTKANNVIKAIVNSKVVVDAPFANYSEAIANAIEYLMELK